MANRRGKKIDYTHWTYSAWVSLAQGVGTSVGATVFAAQHQPETLLRFRGNHVGFLDGAGAPGEFLEVGVGLILVPEGTGSTVLWSPIADGDAPWIWVDYYHLAHEELVVDVVDVQLGSYRSSIDNKAMRIIRNQEVQVVTEVSNLSSGSDINVAGQVRGLFGH